MNRKINQEIINNIIGRKILRYIKIPLLVATLKIPIYESKDSHKKRLEKYKQLKECFPIIKDNEGNIIDGLHRKAIADQLGIELPVLYIDN